MNDKGLSIHKTEYPNKFGKLNDSMPLQVIFYGAPGTGKSHTTDSIIAAFPDYHQRTTFHPDSDYSSFVGCYKPSKEYKIVRNDNLTLDKLKAELRHINADGETYPCHRFAAKYWKSVEALRKSEIEEILLECGFKSSMYQEIKKGIAVGKFTNPPINDGKLTYKFVPQVFLKAYVEAWRNPGLPYFLVIEEINRGNCAQIFGDIFQLLDRDKTKGGVSKYTITPDDDIRKYLEETFATDDFEHLPFHLRLGERMQLPGNLYILATMNTSDQSLFPIDSAFKRRWAWKYKPIEQGRDKQGNPYEWQIRNGKYAYDWWEFISKINAKVEDATQSEDKKMGFWFTSPENGIGYITQEDFISKVLFYLWNDVYKDLARTDETIFKGKPVRAEGVTEEPESYEIFFTHFFHANGSVETRVRDFMRFNGIAEKDFINPELEKKDGDDEEDRGDNTSAFIQYWQKFRDILLTMPLGERIKDYQIPNCPRFQISLPNDAGLTNTFVLSNVSFKKDLCSVCAGFNGAGQPNILSFLYDRKDEINDKLFSFYDLEPEWSETDYQNLYITIRREGIFPQWQAECMQKMFDFFSELLKDFHPESMFKTSTGHKVSGDYQNRLDEAMSHNPILKDAFYRNYGGAYHLSVPGTSNIKIACYNLKDHVSMAVRVDKNAPKVLEWVEQNIQTLASDIGETLNHEMLASGYHIFVIYKPGSIDYSNTDSVNEAISWHVEKSKATYNALVKLLETK